MARDRLLRLLRRWLGLLGPLALAARPPAPADALRSLWRAGRALQLRLEPRQLHAAGLVAIRLRPAVSA